MSSGSLSSGTQVPVTPEGEFRERYWNGGNDPKRVAENPYILKMFWQRCTTAYQKNPYYPYVPAYFYSATQYMVNKTTLYGKPIDGNTALKALGKVREAIKSHDFDATSALADVEATLELLVGSIKACFDMLRALRRMDFQECMRTIPALATGSEKNRKGLRNAIRTKDIGNVWLAGQYGWKPLINDVEEALEAWRKRHALPRSLKFTATARSPDVYWDCRSDSVAPVPLRCVEIIRYCVTFNETLSPFKYYGLDNWATVIWERIPFSFVVDWFIPIGNAIMEFGFFRGLSYKVTITTFQRFSGDITLYAYPLEDKVTGQRGWTPGKLTVRAVNLNRTVSDNIGFTLPSLKSFAKAFSTEHSQNAAALIYGWIDGFRDKTRPSFRPF